MITHTNNNRYHNLKTRLLKTLRSVRHILLNNNYATEEVESYSKRVSSGIMNLFKSDTREFISLISEPKNIKVIIKGQYICNAEIVPSQLIGYISYKDISPDHMVEHVKNYVNVYMRDILSGELTIDPSEYVDAILENYLDLTRNTDTTKKPYSGKLQLY